MKLRCLQQYYDSRDLMPFTKVLKEYLWPSGLTPCTLVFNALTLNLPIHTLSEHKQIFTALSLLKFIQRVTALLSHQFLTTDQWLLFRWHMNYCLITNRCPREHQHQPSGSCWHPLSHHQQWQQQTKRTPIKQNPSSEATTCLSKSCSTPLL
jgi:hypothetical protein